MRTITEIQPHQDWTLVVTFANGTRRRFDVKPLLDCEAFTPLRDLQVFRTVHNGGYYIYWDCEADLSADTLFLDGEVA